MELMPTFFDLAAVLAFPASLPSLGQGFRTTPVQFVIQAGSYAESQALIDKLMVKASEFPGLVNLDSDLKLNKPQLAVSVDRERAAVLGVDIDTLGRTLEALLQSWASARFPQANRPRIPVLRAIGGLGQFTLQLHKYRRGSSGNGVEDRVAASL